MSGEFNAFGKEDALETLGLEKHAFAGALFSAGRAALAPVGRKIMQTGAGRALAPATGEIATGARSLGRGLSALPKATNTAIERGVTQGAQGIARGLGASDAAVKTVGQKAFGAVRGMPKEVATQAGFGGLMMGGLGAATAEEGQRWDAFKSGLGEGALFGGLSGVVGGAVRNMRRGQLRHQASRMAKSKPNSFVHPKTGRPISANQAAEMQLNQGMLDTLKGTVSGKGPMGHRGNIADTAGMLGQFGAEWYVPGMALTAMGSGESPAAPKTASDKTDQEPSLLERLPKRYLGSAAGSALGFQAGSIPLGIAREMGHLKGPYGVLARGLIPAATGLAGGFTGYTVGSKYDQTPPLVQNLQKVDFDQLLKHYNKEDTKTAR